MGGVVFLGDLGALVDPKSINTNRPLDNITPSKKR